jgi:2-keto-4-pentenoate hydratase
MTFLASALVEARRTGRQIDYVPQLDPGSADASYETQAQVARELGETAAGWKCGLQDEGRVVFGAPVLASNVRRAGGVWRVSPEYPVKIEVEIALLLGRDLPPRPDRSYTRAEILDATAAVFAGIEIVASRFRNPGEASLWARVADNFSQGGYVTSEGTGDFASIDLSRLRSRLWIDGALVHDVVGGHQQIDPLVPVVAWASRQADRLGGLKAGQFITTGTLNDPPAIARAATIEVEIASLGRNRLQLET